MKHVKLFEQFLGSVNEKFTKKDAKQLIKDLKSDGLDASGDENWIQVDGVDSPNSNYDGTVSMAWDPSAEEAYSDDETFVKPVKTVDDFMDILNYPEDTNGMWESVKKQVNEAVNASGYIKAGKLGYNDQFLGRQSLSRTLSLDLGLKASNEFVGPWIGFDHVSMYVSGKKGATILDDALTGKYTYDELKAAAAEHMGIKE